MEIKDSSSIKQNNRTTSISIGASRVGKTHFIGTMADVGKLLILDAEDGLKTIRDKKFDYVTVNNWVETEEALNWVMTNSLDGGYTHFAVDSLNRVQTYFIEYITAEKDEHGKNAGMMTMNKWGVVLAKIRKIVDVLTKQLPLSVHMNVTAMESKDEVTGATMLYPALSGTFKHEVLGYFDTILYHRAALDNGNQKYWCQLGADSRIIAGTRIQELKNKFGDVMPNDYAHIHEALNN